MTKKAYLIMSEMGVLVAAANSRETSNHIITILKSSIRGFPYENFTIQELEGASVATTIIPSILKELAENTTKEEHNQLDGESINKLLRERLEEYQDDLQSLIGEAVRKGLNEFISQLGVSPSKNQQGLSKENAKWNDIVIKL